MRLICGLVVVAVVLACASQQPPPVVAHDDTWWRRDVVYEIFVRSFADSDGDGVGDLRGVTAHLDDLRALGVDDVWLMPIFPSPSDHGYDVTDETGVNPAYGTLADFTQLVDEAHRRHMHVILDFVLNHTSDEHPWFTSSSSSPTSPTRGYYVWRDAPDARWTRPWDHAPVFHEKDGAYYLGLFSARMPDLNLANADVERAMTDAMRTWLARGVDGFRLDAVRHLIETDHDGAVQMTDTPETHALLRRMHSALAATKPDVLLVAEAWSNNAVIASYASADQTQLAFSFDVAAGLVASVATDDRAPFVEALDGASGAFTDASVEAPFLTNHDQARAMRAFGGDVDKAKLAAALLLSLPGTPFLYYGEEIGMQGNAAAPDENKRTPLHWSDDAPGFGFTTSSQPWFSSRETDGVSVAAARADPASLWSTYRALIALRHTTPALTSSTIVRVRTDGAGRGAVAFVRGGGAQRVLVVANLGVAASAPFTADVADVEHGGGSAAATVAFARGLIGPVNVVDGGVAVPAIAAHGFAFIAVGRVP